ncbi:hypothetical protein MATL_G00226850 [Megalops atlanticus]|uniref:HECT domain-containing protein n=1 Tax=Megalops atlanticus TaxID=7932 RepID=A0A9D3PH48_MEGAT|nr:hypothetical protein MATL_G00226850 [Megalops atlanticus]
MYCWGDGSNGQLGVFLEGNESIVLVPKDGHFSVGQISQIASGEQHTVFLTTPGKILTCGRNSKGQLGRPKKKHEKTPVEVEGLGAVVGVACGRDHCLALCEPGQVYSWGHGSEGQLGTGTPHTKTAKPRKVRILSPTPIPITQVACGNFHSMALTKGGDVFAWGQNAYGQLGLGKAVSMQHAPCPVLSLTGVPVVQISAGGEHSFLLSHSGLVYCCGANAEGQLGLNRVDIKGRFSLCEVPALRLLAVSSISCGEAHSAVLTKDGRVFTFGEGSHGQLGHNSTANELLPRRVERLEGQASQVACGSHHTLVLTSSGSLLAFGSGDKGQLGTGNLEDCMLPIPVKQTWSCAEPSAQKMIISAGWNTGFLYFAPGQNSEIKDQICKVNEDKLKKWMALKKVSKDAEREISLVFSSSSSLVANFTCNSKPPVSAGCIDMHAVRRTFTQLKEMPQITKLISLVPLIEHLLRASPVMKSVDIFLILPECHVLHEDVNIITTVLPLAEAIVRLSDTAIKSLRKRWSSLERNVVVKHIHMWKRAVAFLVKSGLLRAFNPGVKNVLQTLKHMYKANKSAVHKVPLEEFCIEEIGLIPLKQDVTLWRQLSQMEDTEQTPAIFCRFPFVLDFPSKIFVFHSDATTAKVAHHLEHIMKLAACPLDLLPSPYFHLQVKRTALIDDTFRQLSAADEDDFRKELVVVFVEDMKQTDVNKRDLFLHLFDELLEPKSRMFIYNESETLVWFPSKPELQVKRYYLFGVLCGMAMHNNNIVHLPFPLVLFKKMLEVKPSLEDLKEFSPVLGKSLESILQYNEEVLENMDLTFSVSWDGKEVDLDPSEKGKLVTHANKKEFVHAYVDYILNKSVEKVFKEFRRGFYKVCDMDVVQFFQPQELRGVLVGKEDYDWDILKQNTQYEDGYHPRHSNIMAFWEVFEDLSPKQKKGFLLFLTGCDRVPILGMAQVKMRVRVLANASQEYFPESLTCHTLLLLPDYQTKERLRTKLTSAIADNRGYWKD